MATLLEDIGMFLTVHTIVTGDGVDLFRDITPDAPSDVVVLHEYPGSSDVPGDSLVHRSVQVTVRSSNADTARTKALSIYNLLKPAESRRVDFTSTRWGQVYLRQPPFKIGVDAQERTTYGFNAGVSTTND